MAARTLGISPSLKFLSLQTLVGLAFAGYPAFRIAIYLENAICKFDEAVVRIFEERNPTASKKDLTSERHRFRFGITANYTQKEREEMNKIIAEPGLVWSRVEPEEDVVKALHDIKAFGYDIRIVSAIQESLPHLMVDKMHWIQQHFHTPDWKARVMWTNDKTWLSADIIVDSDPNPECIVEITGKKLEMHPSPPWKHVVFDKPYNRKDTSRPRLRKWINWRVEIPLPDVSSKFLASAQQLASLPSIRHGSPDSLDVDKFYVCSSFPDASLCNNFCRGTEEDRNIILVREAGVIEMAFKGRADECNNALLATYSLHTQQFPNPLKRKVNRIVPLKAIGTLRKVIGRLSKSIYRNEVREAVKLTSPISAKLKLLESIDFTLCVQVNVDDLKFLAFQFAQTLALINGKELFTKAATAEMFPDLRPFLYRDEKTMKASLELLNVYKRKFAEIWSKVTVHQQDTLMLLHCDPSVVGSEWNYFWLQTRGLVIDGKGDMVVSYPIDHHSLNSKLKLSPECAATPDWFSAEDPALSLPALDPLAEIVTVKWSTTDRHLESRSDLKLAEGKLFVRLFGEKNFSSAAVDQLRAEIQSLTILPPPADCDAYWWCYEVIAGKPSRLIARRHKLTNAVHPC